MQTKSRTVLIPDQGITLQGNLVICEGSSKLVLFSHGSGSSRKSPRNRLVAEALHQKGISTLLFDLLTEKESPDYAHRFNIPLLTHRLLSTTDWIIQQQLIPDIQIGYFGASTGAAAALLAATRRNDIKTVVSRGGRPDLVIQELPALDIPVLFIVGEKDEQVLALNRQAFARLGGRKKLQIIPGATHLFEEEGAIEEVARSAASWFDEQLKKPIRLSAHKYEQAIQES